MATRIPGLTFTRKQLRDYAYREARAAGFDATTSEAVAQRVLERVLLEGGTPALIIEQELRDRAIFTAMKRPI